MLDTFLVFLTSIIVFFYSFIVQPVEVFGEAMAPNYTNGQKYLVDKTNKDFKRGDVVVFDSPQNKNNLFIKRIIGLPGEMIKVEGGQVWIDGQILEESYLKEQLTSPGAFLREGQEYLIPADNYMVFGDNRNNSLDSRSFGYIKEKDINGKIGIKYSD